MRASRAATTATEEALMGYSLISCLRKRRWYSVEAARREAATMQEEHRKPFGVYWCVFCNSYHIGKQPQQQRRQAQT